MNAGSPDAAASARGQREERPERYGHFEILRRANGALWQLGEGAMGVTFKARDTRLEVTVALKLVRPGSLGAADAKLLFVREARAAARIRHPHVASVLYLNDDPEELFFAMEFVDGLPLHAWLQAQGRIEPALALTLAAQLAHGLQAVHEQGLIHRDLKPANVMLVTHRPGQPRWADFAAAGGRQARIIDFGLARNAFSADTTAVGPTGAVTALAETRGFRGTPLYASPEQCEERRELDGRSDLYSLGCLLWEMLTGRPPFQGDSHFALLRQHIVEPPPWAQLADLPEPVRAVLTSLLAKAPAERPANAAAAAELLEAAARACQGLPPATTLSVPAATTAPPPTRIARTTLTLELPTVRAAWLVALGLLLLGGLGYGTWRVWPARPAASRPSQAPKVVAVLPFKNIGGDPENAVFADGVHEDVITALAKLRNLRVIARSSVLRFQNSPAEASAIARELQADAVLEGSVRRSGGRIRVSTRLLDGATGQSLWAGDSTRDLLDVFEIQATIARELAAALSVVISAGEQSSLARRPTTDAGAYELYLRARSIEQERAPTPEKYQAVLPLYTRALELDPQFAEAQARFAVAAGMLYWFGVERTPANAARTRAAAERALALAPDSAEAHIALGEMYYCIPQDWAAALAEFRRALQLEPSSVVAHTAAARALRRLGRLDEAVAILREGEKLSPNDAYHLVSLAETLMLTRRFREADALAQRIARLTDDGSIAIYFLPTRLELDDDIAACRTSLRAAIPRSASTMRLEAWEWLGDWTGLLRECDALPPVVSQFNALFPCELLAGRALLRLGRREEGLAALRTAVEKFAPLLEANEGDPRIRMQLAEAHSLLGEREAALREGRRALAEMPPERDAFFHVKLRLELAGVLGRVGEQDEACAIYEDVLARGGYNFNRAMLRHFARYDDLRGFPRFDRLCARPAGGG
ncbi:MAG: protein kinase [Verrucomicrobia bacterium]|nr:protein kinase [Verrucomicrobiota bacterium]